MDHLSHGLRTPILAVLLAGLLAPPAAAQPVVGDAAPDTFTVATLNIWHDRGDWPVRLDLIAEGLDAVDPDVVMLQEVLQDADLPNQAETIAARLGLPHVHFVSFDSAGSVKRYGNAILSRHPFEAVGEARLPPESAFRTAAYALIRPGGEPVRIFATHLHHPATPEGAGIRAMEIVHLLAFVEAHGPEDAPFVLGGDFNAEPDNVEMRLLGGLRDLGGAAITFGPAYTGTPGRRIDYLFDDADPRLVPVESGLVAHRPDAEGRYPSDHFGVYVHYRLSP